MLNKQCAPSNSPVRILSRTFAHDASLDTITLTPYFLKRPSSCAITMGAQSVSGINPSLMGCLSSTEMVDGVVEDKTSSKSGAIRKETSDFILDFFMMIF